MLKFLKATDVPSKKKRRAPKSDSTPKASTVAEKAAAAKTVKQKKAAKPAKKAASKKPAAGTPKTAKKKPARQTQSVALRARDAAAESNFERQMRLAREIMREDHEILAALAK